MRAFFLIFLGTGCHPSPKAEIPLSTLLPLDSGDSGDSPETDPCPDPTLDEDGDGYTLCVDCDDTNNTIHPDALEICDPLNADEDCNGVADDADPDVDSAGKSQWYPDVDGDSYGMEPGIFVCDPPADYLSSAGDCDDHASNVHPDAPEICGDGIDSNCIEDCAWSGTTYDSEATRQFTGLTNANGASSGFLGGNITGGADINGDGYADIALSDRTYDVSSSSFNQGRVYLLSGGVSGIQNDLPTATAIISGDGASDRLGGGVGMVADLDGNGCDELLIGASTDNASGLSDSGSAFLFRGPLSSQSLVPADANIVISGDSTNNYTGWVVDGAGDLTGDHIEDWVISAYFADNLTGKVAIVSGALTDGNYSLANMAAVIEGQSSNERFGTWVKGGTDLNGDGMDDLAVAALGTRRVSIFYGPITHTNSNAADVQISGVDLTANTSSQEANCIGCIATAGDPNQDGYEDLLLGTDGYDQGDHSDIGAAFLMNGPLLVDTSTANASASFIGTTSYDFVGRAVAGGGDIDNDGFDDLLIGAHGYDVVDGEGWVGLAYGPVYGSTLVTSLPGFIGSNYQANLGAALAMVGDVDGNGTEDFMLGAPNASDENGTRVGQAFLYDGLGE